MFKESQNNSNKPGFELVTEKLMLKIVHWVPSWIWWMGGGVKTRFKGLLNPVQKLNFKCMYHLFFQLGQTAERLFDP
jgi:hypothetical protein